MNRIIAITAVGPLGAGATQAQSTNCMDPTTHKSVECSAVIAPAYTPAPAAGPIMTAQMEPPGIKATLSARFHSIVNHLQLGHRL